MTAIDARSSRRRAPSCAAISSARRRRRGGDAPRTLPSSSTMPVNISAAPSMARTRGGRRRRERATSAAATRGASAIVGGAGRAKPGSAVGAEHRRRDVRDEPVGEPGREQRAVQRRAAFDQRLQHAVAAEQLERRVEVDARPSARRDGLDLGAGRQPRVLDGLGRRGVGGDDERRRERRRRTAARSAGTRPRASSSTRSGCRRRAASTSRTVSAGRSASAVPAPTTTACESARSSCASARAAAPVIHARCRRRPRCGRRGSSRSCSDEGRPAGAAVVQVRRELTRLHASAPTPTVDARRPAAQARRCRGRRHAGRDRSSATTTRATPASISASVHGRRAAVVGARLEGDVGGGAPGALARRRAAPRPRRGRGPGARWRPSPTIAPPSRRARSRPTGCGAVRRRARRAQSRTARRQIASLASPSRRTPFLGSLPDRGTHGRRRAGGATPRRRHPLPSGLSPSAPDFHLVDHTAGCRGLAGFRRPCLGTAGRDLHPTPRASVVGRDQRTARPHEIATCSIPGASPWSVRAAAGEQVEGVRRTRAGRPRGTRPRRSPSRAGCRSAPGRRCRTRRATSMPKPRPPASLAPPHRLGEARGLPSITARVPSGVRSRGPKPVPPVVTTSPAKPPARSRSAAATASTPSAVTRWSTTS